MNTGVIRSMLLLEEPNISGLRLGIESYAKVFLSVAFVGALTWEFLTDMKFMAVVKNLVLALVFMGCFYEFHTKAVDLSFTASEELLREVSPHNIFLRKWTEVKVKTTDNSSSNFIEKIAIPNLNDLLGTALFLMSKVCILILKLIYTTVYYFTFIFAPITAVLSFLPVSKHSMAGTITSSLWCILLPFVLVVFLALVGNSVQMPAENGNLSVSSMDQLIWIFGITLLMLLAPSFTFSLIKGSVASTADAVGIKMTGVGAQALISLPIIYGLGQKVLGKGKGKGKGNKGSNNNFKSPQNFQPYSRKYSPDGMEKRSSNSYQNSLKEKKGLNAERSNQNTVKLSEMKTNQQNTKQDSSVATTPSLPSRENIKTNIVNSKIPGSSLNSNQNLSQNRSEGKTNINSSSNFFSKNVKPSSQLPMNNKATPEKNFFKPVQSVTGVDTKSRLERILPQNLKKTLPKERQREV
ncbi:MAG: hypothetical protein Q7U04_15390 [Bacteriovorax sp.]|nr:hypothetical protein [Bacteriovorax sp.]